jgi:predicted AAA+ superfamily ATPase
VYTEPMNSTLRTLLYEWRDRKLPALIPRDITIDTTKRPGDNNATVITGFRRVGKTYIVYNAIEKLLQEHEREDVVYINFEDERLQLQTSTLTDLLPEIQATYGKKPKYLFLDELQVIPNWSKWVRRILDSEDIQIFITGSSSKLSSYEIPTELRGRSWEVRVSPLNFSEFLRFKNTSLDTGKMAYVKDEQARFQYLFEEYLKFGALPAVVLAESEKKQELLQTYFQTVVQLEIGERNQIGNEAALRALLKIVINASSITISKLHNTLKSMGIPIGKTTVDNYLQYIENSYFMRQLPIYNASVVNQLNYPRKVYFVDTGFITALSTKFSANMGRLFENAVFNRLSQQYDTIHYYKDDRDYEVDFVILEDSKATALYQVCYDLSGEETRNREVRSLVKAGASLKCSNLYLITLYGDNNTEIPPEITVLTPDKILW